MKRINTFNNSIAYNPLNDDETLLNYKAFVAWICGFKIDNKIVNTDSISQVCKAYKLYDTEKYSKANTYKRGRKLIAINIHTNEELIFNNSKEVAKYFEFKNHKTISSYVNTSKKIRWEWELRYLDNEGDN